MPILPIDGDCRVQFEAIDPTTGTAVAGVKISLAVIYATDQAQELLAIGDSGPFMLVPGPTPTASANGAGSYPGAH
jgi:hypothetical protein